MKANAEGGKNISFPEKHAARFRFCFRNDMRLAHFQRVRGLDAEWKLSRYPIEYCLPNLTLLWANRSLGANRSDVVFGGIFNREVNVTVCFHFCVNDAASERMPLFL